MTGSSLPNFSVALREATSSRPAIFVTFFYRVSSLCYLARVLSNLSDFIVETLHVTIITNVTDFDSIDQIAGLARIYLRDDMFSVLSRPGCSPPQLLTWEHKDLLRAASIKLEPEFTHFIYLEDDIDLTFRNFLYFLQSYPVLKHHGLIPSFIRTEFNYRLGDVFSCDAVEPTVDPSFIMYDEVVFAAPNYPYCGMFIMDRSLINEYVNSLSFRLGESAGVCAWGPMERSSMGLCWEKPPLGFKSRYVVATTEDLRVLPACQIAHMPDKYANASAFAKSGKLGKLRLLDVFQKPT